MDECRRNDLVAATGQRQCWNEHGEIIPCSGTGQDGELRPGRPWPSPRFSVGAEGVYDRLSGLTWSTDANHFKWPMSWSEAHEAVGELRRRRHLGRDDWRLPDRRELWSLISFAERNPALPAEHPFGNIFLGWYWTATTAARNPGYAWAVQVAGGRVFYEGKERDAFVWPCRGPGEHGQTKARPHPATGEIGETVDAPLRERFQVADDRVVDRSSGLCWMRSANLCRGPAAWCQALDEVRRLRTGRDDCGGWRLPTIVELDSLVDTDHCDPSLPSGHPFSGIGAGYWSSTSSSFEPDWAMVLHLDRGAIGVGLKRDPRYFVWPVRDAVG
ncbi:MAG: DUF1566 domain-containing protein [Candidatus Sulfomarinibacteraceae bacterium]